MKCSAILSNIYVFDSNPLKKGALSKHVDVSESLSIYSEYIKEVLTGNKKCHILEDIIQESIETDEQVIFEKIVYYLFPFFSKGRHTKYMLIASCHLTIEASGFSELNYRLFSYTNYRGDENTFKNKVVTCIQKSEYFKTNSDWIQSLRNIGRFKLYAFIESTMLLTEDERFCVLSDFCSAIPSGTTAYSLGLQDEVKNADLAYAPAYLENLKTNNFKTIYQNWSVLALLDACIILHDPYKRMNGYDKRENSINVYHKMYVLNLFNYFFLEEINNYSRAKNYSENHLFKVFLNYNKYYNLDSVSTKFLPNILNDVMKKGVEMEQKYESTKSKIMQEKDYAIEKSSELTSKVLLVIAVLSLSSFIADTADWVSIFSGDVTDVKFSIVSYVGLAILFVVVSGLMIWFLKYLIAKKMLK